MKPIEGQPTHHITIFWIFGLAGIILLALLTLSGQWQAVTANSREQEDPPPPDTSKNSHGVTGNQPAQVMAVEAGNLYEGFESNIMPPIGWTLVQSNTSQTWKISTTTSSYSGTHAADVEYDASLYNQDEILLSPPIYGDTGSVSFLSEGSIYWCRNTYDNCDLQVWLVRGNWGGSDDVLLGKGDDAWLDNWVWAQSSFDFSDALNGSARIAFRYTGNDGAQVVLDHISISYSGNVPTFLPFIINNPLE